MVVGFGPEGEGEGGVAGGEGGELVGIGVVGFGVGVGFGVVEEVGFGVGEEVGLGEGEPVKEKVSSVVSPEEKTIVLASSCVPTRELVISPGRWMVVSVKVSER